VAEAETLAVATELAQEETPSLAPDAASDIEPEPEPEIEQRETASEDLAAVPPEDAVAESPLVEATLDADDPLRRPIGEGWALYFYSFDDSLDAERSAVSLASTGWSLGVRGFDIEGRGRWFRVLVGRFDTRGEAAAKSDVVSEELDLDWVGVARVRR
jgi:cell division protein FtsN